MSTKRAAIYELFQAVKKPSEIFKLLKPRVSRSGVYILFGTAIWINYCLHMVWSPSTFINIRTSHHHTLSLLTENKKSFRTAYFSSNNTRPITRHWPLDHPPVRHRNTGNKISACASEVICAATITGNTCNYVNKICDEASTSQTNQYWKVAEIDTQITCWSSIHPGTRIISI